MPENCLFCKIVRGEIPAEKLYEDADVVAFRDIAPQAPLHVLVIPKKHLDGPAAVSVEDERVVGKMMRVATRSPCAKAFRSTGRCATTAPRPGRPCSTCTCISSAAAA